MKLFYLPGACSLASHIALHEAGLAFKPVKVDRASKRTEEGEDYNAINPKGYVPALQLDSGEVLTENVAVLQYIADQAPSSGLAPPAGSMERYRLIEWLAFINSEFHKAISPLFNPAATEETKTYARNYASMRADFLDRAIGSKPGLTSDRFTIADAYLFVVLTWFGPYTQLDLSRWPNLKAYHDRIRSRPAVTKALQEEGLLKQ